MVFYNDFRNHSFHDKLYMCANTQSIYSSISQIYLCAFDMKHLEHHKIIYFQNLKNVFQITYKFVTVYVFLTRAEMNREEEAVFLSDVNFLLFCF